MAVRILVLAVPSGMPSLAATSDADIPAIPASTSARACSTGRRRSAVRSSPADLTGQGLVLGAVDARGHLGEQRLGIDGDRAPDAHGVDGQVPGDGRQPRRHSPTPLVESVPVAPRPFEGLLGDVFGGNRITGDGEGHAVELGLEPSDEGHRQLGVTGREAGKERLVGELLDGKTDGRTASVTAVGPGRTTTCLRSRRRKGPPQWSR